tara:strand:+ start:920 stop:1183 length:264 start_codon:yes stop_codon:yes gene_type:complete
MLSPAARALFPYSVECKNQESLNVWNSYAQATANCGENQPALFIKRNRHKPLVVLDAEHFIQLAAAQSRLFRGTIFPDGWDGKQKEA